MKRIFDIIRTAAILMVLSMSASCLKVDILKPVIEDGQFSLTLKCSDIAQTRATETEAGEDAYNENKIGRLDVFFYAAEASDAAEAIYRMTLTSLNATGSYTYDQRIETTVIETIFGTGENARTKAKIYAIANLPAGVTVSDNASVNNLKAITIETAALAGTVEQDNFVMDSTGDDIVSYDSATRSIICDDDIKLYRAASKIGLFITSVTDVPVTDADGNPVLDDAGDPVMWVANTDGMLVRLNNGVKKTRIDADYTIQTADYFSFAAGQERSLQKPEGKPYWQQDIPFYSYPSNWSESGSDREAYLTLIVPWAKSDDPDMYYPTYYQVPVNGLTQQLSRNSYYKINLEVSRLGKFTEEESITITPGSYLILDWTTNTIDADMLDYRYLVVDQKEYTIYNQNELYIPFASSHTAEITNVTFAQQDINVFTPEPSWPTINSGTTNYLDALDIIGNKVYFRNDLDNVYTSSTFDFTPYKLTFRIKHTGTAGNTYYEDITVYQYPAIYGSFRQNSDYSSNGGSQNGNHGYTFVNGYYSSGESNHYNLDDQDFFCSVPGLSNQGASPNLYVFNITSVQGTDYVIGDPRTVEIDNSLVNAKRTYRSASNTATAWVQAPALYDNASNRGLMYYYPTDVDYTNATTMQNSRTRNMIAPQFRIASAYGVLHTGSNNASASLEGMRKRCASYQEDGYPAGRWRLPTEAEFMFIIKQVNRNPATLPQLYISGYSYWCAHGLGKVNGTNVTMDYTKTSSGNSTRCVYDTWYWGDERLDDPNVFTWGDMPR